MTFQAKFHIQEISLSYQMPPISFTISLLPAFKIGNTVVIGLKPL